MNFFLVVTEIARQAAQIKLLRKLQKQEQARAAKEAKKQQGMDQTCEGYFESNGCEVICPSSFSADINFSIVFF